MNKDEVMAIDILVDIEESMNEAINEVLDAYEVNEAEFICIFRTNDIKANNTDEPTILVMLKGKEILYHAEEILSLVKNESHDS